jgi:hypothetical protein
VKIYFENFPEEDEDGNGEGPSSYAEGIGYLNTEPDAEMNEALKQWAKRLGFTDWTSSDEDDSVRRFLILDPDPEMNEALKQWSKREGYTDGPPNDKGDVYVMALVERASSALSDGMSGDPLNRYTLAQALEDFFIKQERGK